MRNLKFGNKLICVKMLDGEIKRILSHDAHFLVVDGDANYCSKTDYHKYIGRAEVLKPVEKTSDELGEVKTKKRKKQKNY